jgi:predicted Rossmann fold flavoprotein
MMRKIIKKEIVIIGAGASGLMFASLHKELDYAIVELNSQIAKKLMVSGGGKCNITNKNISLKNYYGNGSFANDILSSFSYIELLDFFSDLEFVKRKKDQFFCKSSAKDIINSLCKRIQQKNIFLNHEVLNVDFKDGEFYVVTKKCVFISKKLIVSSGGVSYPQLGVSDVAYKIATKFGHTISKIKPALVGFTLQKSDFWMKELSGISLQVKLRVGDKTFYDDLLFAHRGISGPVVLNASLYWEKGSIEIDFLPKRKLLLKEKSKQISSNLPLPKRFVKEFLKNLDLKDKVVSRLNHDEYEKLKLLKSYKLSPAGDFGYKKAEVTKGGIKTDEIDSKTMESKLQKGLYFLGECLDVTGELGGYNIHFAFATAKRICF